LIGLKLGGAEYGEEDTTSDVDMTNVIKI